MEQEIRNAVGLGSPELLIEPKPTVKIYDFGALFFKHELPKKER